MFYTLGELQLSFSLIVGGELASEWIQAVERNFDGVNQENSLALANEIRTTLLFALIPIVIAFSFIVFVFYRARREASFRQKETELKLNIAEGEIKALRAQINPHFIFNCLNSIHHFMQKNDNVKAGNYLLKFSKLIRHSLESSELRMVSLLDEMEANENYMQLEQLRLNNSFVYKIGYELDLKLENIQIPPMIIQPFIENAIWHGISQKGHIGLIFKQFDDRHLHCTIWNNGGSDISKTIESPVMKAKKTSLGMNLIQGRLSALNQLYGYDSSFIFSQNDEDTDGRSIVTVKIPFED